MTEYMYRDDYELFVALTDEFTQVLLECAQEISMISNGRMLVGKFNGHIKLWDGGTDIWHDERYYVEFERYSCGKTDYDHVYVPVKYIYNGEYRKRYNERLIQEKEMKVRATLDREDQRKANIYRDIVAEHAIYEMLKKKFGY